ncbi:MAG: ABC transporter ATP-binding protein [Methanomicrobiales archaeon]|nr:ABC transporter ATP-binding protein [Methanomicrobiales archaeon]
MTVIEVRNLNKDFGGAKILKGISFSVDEGEIFGFLGPNGAGKTTTMRILLGLLRPSSGEALVSGANLADNDDLRQKVGVLLENNGLYDRLSAYENLDYYARLYGRVDDRERIDQMLLLTGLQERKDDPVGTFSLGMKRKLGLARAIIHEPEFLFLDEPTSGLDPEAQRMVRDLILDLSRKGNITVFLNSHHLDEVEKICSKVAILHRGTIRACDSVENLRESSGVPVVEFTTANRDEIPRAKDALLANPGVESVQEEGQKLVVLLRTGHSLAAILRDLVLQGIGVEEVKKVNRSLEDIYLEAVHEQEGSP